MADSTGSTDGGTAATTRRSDGAAANSEINAAFAGGPAFIPYLAVGDPSYEASKAYVEALARGGADVIELGLPFSEPIAEGPTIQGAIVRALEAGMTPELFFEFVDDLAVDVPLVCMTYYNLIYQYSPPDSGDSEVRRASETSGAAASTGPAAFVARAADAGIAGLVVPDLPAEEADPLRAACDEHGLDLVFIVAPTTEGDRLESMMERVSGYVYVQARLGTTGAKSDVSDQTDHSLQRLSEWAVPKAVGFGISTGEQAERIVASGADGIIVGSALVDIVADGIDNERSTEETATKLEAKAEELAEGAARGATEPAAADAE